MKWPWQAHRQTAAQRAEAEAYAEKVHREVIEPLRRMRAQNHLTDALVATMRRNLKEGGS